MRKLVLAILLFDSIALGANQKISGYENIKFGMSYQDIANVNVCKTFEPVHPFGSPHTITTTTCKDFVVDGEATSAKFIFKKGKLARFSFVVPDHVTSNSEKILQYLADAAKNYGPEKSDQMKKNNFLRQLTAVWEVPFGNGQARILFLNTNVWDKNVDGSAVDLVSSYQIEFGSKPLYMLAVFNSSDFIKVKFP